MSGDSSQPAATETRKLAAIMFTDIAGFSRQMGTDEARMLRLLDVHNRLIQQAVSAHHGTVIKTVGDAFLVDFPSVVHAVQCGQQIQSQFRTHNNGKENAEQTHVRIGIHLGDIVQRDGDVFGDGVNIASRLQALAEPDTIYISQAVYKEVEKKLALGTVVSLGKPKLKNIAERFVVYALLPVPPVGVRQKLQVQRLKLSRRVRPVHWLSVAGLLLIAGTLLTVHYLPFLLFLLSPPQPFTPSTEATLPPLPLPDKPSIVILPFVNMSQDPEQEYFSDGITEDITTDLSRLSSLFVISRNTAFTYKGKAVKLSDLSKELGVQYVLEGSVRKAKDQVRITTQLIDATTGEQLWSERYDRPLQDIFALQDEIRQKIVLALKVQLTPEEQERFKRAPTSSLEAYDCFLRGQEAFFSFTKEGLQRAQSMFARALALDPHYAGAYAAASIVNASLWYFWTPEPQILEQAFDAAQKAVALDDSLALAHSTLGRLYLVKKQHDQAIAETERAIALDPNNAAGYANLGFILNWAGQPEKTIGLLEKAMRLDPHYPSIYLVFLGQAYRLTERYEDATSTYKKALARTPDILGAHAGLAITYSMMGKDKEARAEGEQILRLNPHYSLENSVQRIWPYKDPALLERDLAALRKAGLK